MVEIPIYPPLKVLVSGNYSDQELQVVRNVRKWRGDRR
nr:MAG TPA: hypothetical protein [Caudoviricetes sp.]DAX84329.1 MAG TPA: hypothetical protein [Caudoviricetes sp.]